MMSAAEQQAEEMTVLQSIYEGDQNFKQLDEKTYQYKFSLRDRSFIVEVAWSLEYPNEKPYFNLDIFYNQHLKPSEREKILNILDIEAEHWLGYAMTYSLFEKVKEKVPFILDLPDDEEEADERAGADQENSSI